MAVIKVTVGGTASYFVIPQDSDWDGMPDIWEAKFAPASGAGSLVASADPDNDGLSNMDEYRGFMLSGAHTRFHPKERDLFIGLVNPGCGAATTLLGPLNPTLLGPGGYIPDLANGRSLFDNLSNLLPATGTDPRGPRIHPVGYPTGAPASHGAINTEWVDDYTACSFDSAINDVTLPGLTDLDRIVMRNALYQVSESPPAALTPSAVNGSGVTFTAGAKVFNQTHVGATLTSGSGVAVITTVPSPTQITANITTAFASTAAIAAGAWRLSGADQKGLRCVESLDTSSTSVFAKSSWTTPDDAHQCSIFSKRIEFRMLDPTTGLIPKGAGRKLRVVTTSNAGKTWGDTGNVLFDETNCGGCTHDEAIRRVVAEVMRFYTTMEYGHGGKLNPTLGTCANHDCTGTGYLNDKDFTQVIDAAQGGYNTFRIPTKSNSTLTSGFKLRNP